MARKPAMESPDFDPLATLTVHLNGLRDYAQGVGEWEMAREIERQVRVLRFAWEKGMDPHAAIEEQVVAIQAAFRTMGYTAGALMLRQRERV